MKKQYVSGLLLIVLGVAGLASISSAEKAKTQSSNKVSYEVRLSSNWNSQTHPLDYPKAGVVTGPHFSGLIGGAHAPGYSLFKEGTLPSPGLERLSEEGKHSPLDKEIKAAVAEGKVLNLVESDPLKDFSKTVTTSVDVNEKYHLVSLVAMIAPSPDWFLGENDIELMENGKFVDTKIIQVYAWDSGGDSGTTYLAPDQDNNPKQATMINKDPHFVISGKDVPVATLTFTRK